MIPDEPEDWTPFDRARHWPYARIKQIAEDGPDFDDAEGLNPDQTRALHIFCKQQVAIMEQHLSSRK